jgi:hypothetical protein
MHLATVFHGEVARSIDLDQGDGGSLRFKVMLQSSPLGSDFEGRIVSE